MTPFLALFAQYRSSYEAAYRSGWIVGFIIGLCIALGVARLVSWGIRVLLTKTVFPGKNEMRRAAFVAFLISCVIAVFIAVTVTSGTPETTRTYLGNGEYLEERFEYFSWVTVSLIYIGLLSVWLFVDLRLADRDYAQEISIFDQAADKQPTRSASAASWPAAQPAPAPNYYTPPPTYQPSAPPPPVYQPPPTAYHPAPPAYQQTPPPYQASYTQPYQPPTPPPYQATSTPSYPQPSAPSYPAAAAAPPPPPAPQERPRQEFIDAAPRTAPPKTEQVYNSEQASFHAAITDLIQQLATLRDSGALSNEEFEQKKTELLKRI